jgi:hypothetical protein
MVIYGILYIYLSKSKWDNILLALAFLGIKLGFEKTLFYFLLFLELLIIISSIGFFEFDWLLECSLQVEFLSMLIFRYRLEHISFTIQFFYMSQCIENVKYVIIPNQLLLTSHLLWTKYETIIPITDKVNNFICWFQAKPLDKHM